jgi:hypothetical protein
LDHVLFPEQLVSRSLEDLIRRSCRPRCSSSDHLARAVNSTTVFQISLGDTLDPAQHRGEVVGINQVIAQHTRYALIVTNGIQDSNGAPVEATAAFRDLKPAKLSADR